ncbi:response regulator transcription factor [uncultured Acetobacterium sp.]|uniref:response regulator transcription factor n=1 Tax=uncultured Acetobacterium sp. TaxID=217139 RepID=UPI0025DC33E9|nr:response regulator transcription factor [uncultured Acetobacterium sp.]
MKNILIADDEKDIVKLLRLYLETDEATIFEAYDGEMAIQILNNNVIDLALLDIMMPRINGFELTKKIRKEWHIPVMIISAKIESADKILGLDLGADDYITKPFDPLEVAARVRARFRENHGSRSLSHAKDKLTVRELILNPAECILYKENQAISLTAVELKLMCLLMAHPGRVFTKEQLYEAGWEEAYAVDDNTIRVAISKLRDKIGAENISTIRGLGYRLEK